MGLCLLFVCLIPGAIAAGFVGFFLDYILTPAAPAPVIVSHPRTCVARAMTALEGLWMIGFHSYADLYWRNFRVLSEGVEWIRVWGIRPFARLRLIDIANPYGIFMGNFVAVGDDVDFGVDDGATVFDDDVDAIDMPELVTGSMFPWLVRLKERFFEADAALGRWETSVMKRVAAWIERNWYFLLPLELVLWIFNDVYIQFWATVGTAISVLSFSSYFFWVPISLLVVLEEVVKWSLFTICTFLGFPQPLVFLFSYYGFALLELVQKIYLTQTYRNMMVLPVFMHFFTGHLSFTGGFLVHTVWNCWFMFNSEWIPLAMFGDRRLHFPTLRERDLIRRKIRAGDQVSFHSKVYHPRKNRDNLVELLNGKAEVPLRGYTVIDGYYFNFPFLGTARDFLRTLDVIADDPGRRDLCLHGILRRELYLRHPECFMQPAVRDVGDVEMKGPEQVIEEFAYIADVLRKLAARDWVGLTLNAGMRAGSIVNFLKMMQVTRAHELAPVLQLCDDESMPELESIEMMGPEPVRARSAPFWDFLPKSVSASPNVRRILALSCIISMSPFVRDLGIVRNISSLVEWDSLPTGGSFLETAAGGVVAVYNVLSNVLQGSHSIEEAVGLPKNVAFITRARELLMRDFGDATGFEIQVALTEVDDLLQSRKFLLNDAEINKLKDRLEALHTTLIKNLENAGDRPEPMFVGLLGEPGVGKTTLLHVITNVLARHMGVKRYPNDALDYNAAYKFGGETNKRHDKIRFFRANDVPKNYSGYRQLDITPLDILLQMAIDTAAFEVRSAAVDSKGVKINKMTHFMLTSNFDSFAGCEETKKLKRRLNAGFTVWVNFMRNGQLVDYDSIPRDSMTAGEYNDCIRFTPGSWTTSGITWTFTQRGEPMSLQEYLRELVAAHDRHQGKLTMQNRTFYSEENRCSCGAPYVMHYTSRGYERLFDTCSVDPAALGQWTLLGEGAVKSEIPDRVHKVRNLRLAREEMKEAVVPPLWRRLWNFWFGKPIDVEMKGPVVVTQVAASVVATPIGWFLALLWSWLYALFGTLFMWNIYSSDHSTLVCAVNDLWRNGDMTAIADIAISYPLVQSAFLFYTVVRQPEEFHRRRIMCSLACVMVRIKSFVRRNAKVLGIAIAGFCVYLLSRSKDVPEMKGRAIFREEVDPDSLYIFKENREQRWTPEQRRAWDKPEDPNFVTVSLEKTGIGFEAMLARARDATRQIELRDSERTCVVAKCVMWNTEWVSINRHFLQPLKGQEVAVTISGIEHLFDRSDFIEIPDTEHYQFRNHFDKKVKPLSDFLCEDPGTGPWRVYPMLTDCEMMATPNSFTEPVTKERFDCIVVEHPSVRGDCGSLLFLSTPKGWSIGGILSAGSSEKKPLKISCYTLMSKLQFAGACRKTPFPEIHDRIIKEPEMMCVSSNSDFRHFNHVGLKPWGTLLGPTREFKTKFVRTDLYDDFSGKLSKEWKPPKKIAGLVNGEYKSSLLHTFEFIDKPLIATDKELMTRMLQFLNHALPVSLVKEKNIKLRPAVFAEAIFGDPSIGLGRVNFKSSCGKEWKEHGINNKTDLFEERDDGLLYMKPVFRDAVAKKLQMMANGDIVALRADFAEKDELRPADKVDAFAIRDFSVVGFDDNIIMRMFCMPIIQVLLAYPTHSECFAQMNAGSREWTELAEYLQMHPNYIDIDFKKMDTSHKEKMIWIFCCFMYLAALRLGYTEEEAAMTYRSVNVLCLQVMSYRNDVAIKDFGLPSGVIVTLIMNSVINSILMRVVFGRLVPEKVFEEHVKPATTGDDNLSGISDEVIDRFNMHTIIPEYLRLGYIITPAKKDGEVRRDLPFGGAVFLKRRFVWSDEMDMYLAPIDTDSIYKALCYQSKEANIDPHVRLAQVALGCQREAFLHGREFFDQMQVDLRVAFRRHQMSLMLEELSYEQLKVEIQEKSFRTWMI